jgi:CRISPR-associated protein Csm5
MTMRYELEVISPLHIGSGDVLTRFDYVWERGRLYAVSLDKLMAQPRIAAEALTDWLSTPGFNMGRYVLETARLDLAMVARYGIPCPSDPDGTNVSQQIKNAFDQPYVPGSSIKGAVRTALAWAILDSGTYVPSSRDMGRSSRFAGRPLEAELFGSDPNHDIMRALQVGDSEPMAADGLEALHSTVYTLMRDGRLRPKSGGRYCLWVEALPVGTCLTGKWHLDEVLLEREVARRLGFDRKRAWLGDVPRHCRVFAAALIERETDFYTRYGPSPIAAFYRELASRLERLADNEFLLQMSWGTGWTSKTVGSALDRALIEEARRRYRLGVRGAPFPKTRRLVERGNTPQEPFGWVLVRLPGFAQAEFAEELPESVVVEATGRQTGRVKWFSEAKGYGFIVPDAGGGDVFVHISNITDGRPLSDGQRVSFVVGPGRKGPEARDVQPV